MVDRALVLSIYVRITLTKGQYAIIDREDLKRVRQYNWFAHYNPTIDNYYAKTFITVEKSQEKKYNREVIQLSNFLKNFIPKDNHGFSIDHNNRDPLDNRKCNLRIISNSQQAINQRIRSNNNSGKTGVYWDKKGYWVSHFRENNQLKATYFKGALNDENVQIKAIDDRIDYETNNENYRNALSFADPNYIPLSDDDKELIEIIPKGNLRKINKTNKTGKTGVCFVKSRNCHLCEYYDENGKKKTKQFGAGNNEDGFTKSKQNATDFRIKMEMLYPNHNKPQIDVDNDI
jgi:hypothetical protein